MGTVVALGGQFGGAKLTDGLYRLRGPDLALIVNTGDDYEHLGLAFSPDLDTALYTLAGMANLDAGWEPEGVVQSVSSLGVRTLATPAVMRTVDDRVALARTVLDFARTVRTGRAMEVE